MVVIGVNSEGHNYNTYKHQVQLGMLKSQCDGAQYVMKSTGFDATCGCICCNNSAIVVRQPPFLPDELNGIFSAGEFNQLCIELNQVFSATVVPAFPCFCMHICIPFSPMIAIMYYRSQRKKGVKRILDRYNETILKTRGAYFESIVELDYIAQLRVDPSTHQKYLNSLAQQAPIAANHQQQFIPVGIIQPPSQQQQQQPYGGYAPGTIVPAPQQQMMQQQQQYVPVSQYATGGVGGGFSGHTVVPLVSAEYIQPAGVVPMQMEKR